MIRRFEVDNFMSLKNVSVDLGPLTVFIGPNGSGKSALFKSLVILSRLLNGAPVRALRTGEFVMEAGVTFDDIVYGGNSGLPIRFRVWFDDDGLEPGYTLELRKDAGGWGVTRERIRHGENWIEVDEAHPFQHPTERGTTRTLAPPLRASLTYLVQPFLNDSAARAVIEPVIRLTKRFGFAYRYRPSASDIASVLPRSIEPGHTFYVGENGRGVAIELQDLQGSNRALFEAIEKAVGKLFPHIKAIGFRSDYRGVRLTFRTDRSEDLIPAPQESDGVLLATFLFWRLYTANPTMKVCLEEPENGLHPFLLAERFQVLKRFAHGDGGVPGVQLLVATHSPEFLRAVKAHPQALWNQIRLVEFTPGAGTSVRGLEHYREATNLIEQYLTQVHEKWGPIIESWGES
jgi:predicted ATPase